MWDEVYKFSAHMTLLYSTEQYCYLLQEQLVHRPIWTVTNNGIPAEEDGAWEPGYSACPLFCQEASCTQQEPWIPLEAAVGWGDSNWNLLMPQYTNILMWSLIFKNLCLCYCYSTQKDNYIVFDSVQQISEIKLYYHTTLNFVCYIYLHISTLKFVTREVI